MRVAVTGTPGTGKTTAVGRLPGVVPDSPAAALDRVDLNRLVREGAATGRDDERGSLVADLDALREALAGREDVLFESHLAHYLDADRVVVLRCHPDELARRLRDRGDPEGKVVENARAEALDVTLVEAIERHGRDRVYELDTTDRTPGDVAREVAAVVAGERDPAAGIVDFSDAAPEPDVGSPAGSDPDSDSGSDAGDGTGTGTSGRRDVDRDPDPRGDGP